MLTDYELFLTGCYGAVVEIKNEKELERFINLMRELGLGVYANYLERVNWRSNILESKKYNNITELCMEYQMGKGFTYGDKKSYIYGCEDTKVLSLEDLLRSVGK